MRRHRTRLLIVVAFAFGLAHDTRANGSANVNTLVTFNSNNGNFPAAGLVADAHGNLYGTTMSGGAYNAGTVFQVAAGTNALTTIASFNRNDNNGSAPQASLIVDAAGNAYGTTTFGTANNDGTVFEIAAGTNSISTLARFNGSNGANPQAPLISDSSGNLYGTTFNGGAYGHGTVFEISAGTHTLTTLASLGQFAFQGYNPAGGLIMDANGNLYGTTSAGGDSFDDGTVFEVAAGTHAVSALARFNNTVTGAGPYAGLLADAAGDLFGTTRRGGPNGAGTVFEVAAGTHVLTDIVTFVGNGGPWAPNASLIADAEGNLFGTTLSGGLQTGGTVFEVAAGTGTLTTLARFHDGCYGNLVADANGDLYGTTGGTQAADQPQFGTVFELTNTGFATSVPEPGSTLSLGLMTGTGLLIRRGCRGMRKERDLTEAA